MLDYSQLFIDILNSTERNMKSLQEGMNTQLICTPITLENNKTKIT